MKNKVRNWIAVSAWNCKGGAHSRSLNEPRGGQRNLQREYLDEYENEIDVESDFNDDFNDCWD